MEDGPSTTRLGVSRVLSSLRGVRSASASAVRFAAAPDPAVAPASASTLLSGAELAVQRVRLARESELLPVPPLFADAVCATGNADAAAQPPRLLLQLLQQWESADAAAAATAAAAIIAPSAQLARSTFPAPHAPVALTAPPIELVPEPAPARLWWLRAGTPTGDAASRAAAATIDLLLSACTPAPLMPRDLTQLAGAANSPEEAAEAAVVRLPFLVEGGGGAAFALLSALTSASAQAEAEAMQLEAAAAHGREIEDTAAVPTSAGGGGGGDFGGSARLQLRAASLALGFARHEAVLWSLVDALFGRDASSTSAYLGGLSAADVLAALCDPRLEEVLLENTEAAYGRRREALAQWLQQALARPALRSTPSPPLDALSLSASTGASTFGVLFDCVHAALARRDLNEATRLAAASHQPVLAALCAQAATENNSRIFLQRQLRQWRSSAALGSKLFGVYALLAGPDEEAEGDSLSTWLADVRARELSWLGAFGLHLLYAGAGDFAPPEAAASAFACSAERGYTALPRPWWSGLNLAGGGAAAAQSSEEAGEMERARDALFLLLQLQDAPSKATPLISPLAHSPDCNEERLPFALAFVLEGLQLSRAAVPSEAPGLRALEALRLPVMALLEREAGAAACATLEARAVLAAKFGALSRLLAAQAAAASVPRATPTLAFATGEVEQLALRCANRFAAEGDWPRSMLVLLLAAGRAREASRAPLVRGLLRAARAVLERAVPPSAELCAGQESVASAAFAKGVEALVDQGWPLPGVWLTLAMARRGVCEADLRVALPALLRLLRLGGGGLRAAPLLALADEDGGLTARAWARRSLRGLLERRVLPALLAARAMPALFVQVGVGAGALQWSSLPGGESGHSLVVQESLSIAVQWGERDVVAAVALLDDEFARTGGEELSQWSARGHLVAAAFGLSRGPAPSRWREAAARLREWAAAVKAEEDTGHCNSEWALSRSELQHLRVFVLAVERSAEETSSQEA